jgi:nucleoside-diphosphate-sugar epimerase
MPAPLAGLTVEEAIEFEMLDALPPLLTTAAKLGGSSKASQPAAVKSVGLSFTRKQERGPEGEITSRRSLCCHLVVIVAKAIVDGTPIKLFNHGNMRRDFTYIDDVSQAVVRLMDRPPQGNSSWSGNQPDPTTSPDLLKIYHIGNNIPERFRHVVSLLEKEFGGTAIKEMLPMQPGDVLATYADVEDLARDIGFRPSTTIEDGIKRFAIWYRDYHRI